MNKYTLSFKNQKIEDQYINHKGKTLQFPTLSYITIGGTILLSINLIIHLTVGKYINAILNGTAILYLLSQFFIIRKCSSNAHYSNYALTINNLIFLMFDCLPKKDDEGYYDGYLLGCNQMLVHTIMMFANSFNLGLATNVSLAASRIGIMNYRNGSMQAQQYIYTILLSFSFLLIQYEIEKQYRLSFLLSLKDSSWELMIPMFLKKPYFLFSFNQEVNTYELHSSFQLEYFKSDMPLTTFLYTTKTKTGQSISTYIENLTTVSLKTSEGICLFNNYLSVEYQQKRIQISVIGCQFEKVMYAIVVENEDPLIKQQQSKFSTQIQSYKELITQQIMPINKVLSVYLSETYHPLLRNLRVSLIEIYYQQSPSCELQLVNIKKLLLKCVKLFQTPDNIIKIICNDDLKFITIKHALITFLFELLKSVAERETIVIEISQDSRTTIQVTGLSHLPNSIIFQISKDILIEKIIRFQSSITFKLYKA